MPGVRQDPGFGLSPKQGALVSATGGGPRPESLELADVAAQHVERVGFKGCHAGRRTGLLRCAFRLELRILPAAARSA